MRFRSMVFSTTMLLVIGIALTTRVYSAPIYDPKSPWNSSNIQELIRNGADVNEEVDGWKILLWAVYQNDIEVVRLLLQQPAIIVDAENASKDTALMIASIHDRADIVSLLLMSNANINAKNDDGNTALMLAASRGKIDTVKKLLKYADVTAKNNLDQTALDIAQEYGHTEIVKLITSRNNKRKRGIHIILKRAFSSDQLK